MRNKRIWVCLLVLLCALGVQAGALATQEPPEENRYQYYSKRVEMISRLGKYGIWPEEEKAALDTLRVELGLTDGDEALHVLPGEGDLSREEARKLAIDAIVEKYQMDAAVLEEFEVWYDFCALPSATNKPWWKLLLQATTPVDPFSAFEVEIASPEGSIAYCQEGYSTLVAFDMDELPAEADDISVEEAARIAWDYVAENHLGYNGLQKEDVYHFTPMVQIYVDNDMGRIYWVELNPQDEQVFSYFGSYNVFIDPKTGIVWEGGKGNG